MWKQLEFERDETGSENGKIIRDEEYKSACRITLEKCARYYAITCGVYGGMVHTVFCSETESLEKYELMKKDLVDFIDSGISGSEEYAFYDTFTAKF